MKRTILVAGAVLISFGLGIAVGGYGIGFRSGVKPDAAFSSSISATAKVSPGPAQKTLALPATSSLASVLQEPNSYRMLGDLTTYANTLPPGELPKVYEQLQGLSGNQNQGQAMTIIAGRWAEVDPEGALASLKKTRSIRSMGSDNALVSAVFSSLAAHDPVDAFNRAQKMSESRPSFSYEIEGMERESYGMYGPSSRSQALQAVITQWAASDPAAALEACESLKGPNQINIDPLFTAWAAHDLDAAADAALHLHDQQQSSTAIASIISAATQQNPASVRDILARVPEGPLRIQAEENYANDLAANDPAAAAAYVEDIPAGSARDNMVQSIAGQWASKDARAALAWTDKLPFSIGKVNALGQIVSSWAQEDPKAAADYVASLPRQGPADNLVGNLIGTWAPK